MLIFGHKFIKNKLFYIIKGVKDIRKTPSNSTVMFDFNEQNLEICYYCQNNNISFALIADKVDDVLFASSLNVAYIICDKVLSVKAQKYADEYMYDAKVLLFGNDESDLEWAAEHGIDGIIFEEGCKFSI